MTRKLLAFLTLFLLSGAFLTGCNTVEGAGEDISAAGEGMSEASRDAREDN